MTTRSYCPVCDVAAVGTTSEQNLLISADTLVAGLRCSYWRPGDVAAVTAVTVSLTTVTVPSAIAPVAPSS